MRTTYIQSRPHLLSILFCGLLAITFTLPVEASHTGGTSGTGGGSGGSGAAAGSFRGAQDEGLNGACSNYGGGGGSPNSGSSLGSRGGGYNGRESSSGGGGGGGGGGGCPPGTSLQVRYCCGGDDIWECRPNPCTPCTSAPNICGQRNSGMNCGGGCSAGRPADPPLRACGDLTANICGMTDPDARYQCNAVNECTPQKRGDYECPLELELYANPPIIRAGETSNVYWDTDERVTASCELTGSSNGDYWTGISGSEFTAPIPVESTYVLSCIGKFADPLGSTTTEELSKVIRILPSIDEN